MSSGVPSDVDARSLIARIREGAVPREFLTMVAAGFLPLPQDDLVAVLAFLTRYDDPEIAGAARKSLADLPLRVLTSHASNQTAHPEDLDALAFATNQPMVLEAIARNRSVSDETIETLARTATAALQEIIVINQERILRRPSILDALLENPALVGDVRRRVLETREEFFEKKARRLEDEAALAGFDLAPVEPEHEGILAELLAQAAIQDAQGPQQEPELDPILAAELDKPDSAWIRILKMTVSQKVQCAFRGGASERAVLIRERNKLVSGSVIRSPRITEKEVEGFAGMRNIDEEVLRIIGMSRQWTAKYPILIALVKNPKAPVGVVLPLINRVNSKDLKSLASDRGVSEAVRQSARRLMLARKS